MNEENWIIKQPSNPGLKRNEKTFTANKVSTTRKVNLICFSEVILESESFKTYGI